MHDPDACNDPLTARGRLETRPEVCPCRPRSRASGASLLCVADKKTAHPIWDMRPADQIAEGERPDADFVLVRRHEEPYVDILEAQARMASTSRRQAWERLADAHAQRRVAEEGGEVPGTNDDGASMGFDITPREASPGETEAAPGETEAAPRIPLEMMDTRREESRYQQEQDDQRRREERNKQRRLQNRPGAEPAIPEAHKPLFDPAHQHEGAGASCRAGLVGRRVRAYHDGGICEGVVMVEFPEGLVDLLLDDVLVEDGAPMDAGGPQRITVSVDDILGETEADEENDSPEDEHKEAGRVAQLEDDGPGEDVTDQIREGIARAIFVLAWADTEESEGRGGMGWAGQDLMNLAPDTSPEAYAKADQIIQQIQQANGKSVTDLFHEAMAADGYSDGEYDYFQANRFGHALGMMALGTGVSWFDDHERFPLKVPHNEFDVAPRALEQGEFEQAMQSQMPTVEADAADGAGADYTEPGADTEFSVDAAALERGTRHVALLSKVALGDKIYTEGALFRVEALSDETLELISEAHRVRHEVSARAYEELTDHGFAEEVYL